MLCWIGRNKIQYNSRQPLFVHPLIGYWVFFLPPYHLVFGRWFLKYSSCMHLTFSTCTSKKQFNVLNTMQQIQMVKCIPALAVRTHTYTLHLHQQMICSDFSVGIIAVTELLKVSILIFDMRSIFSTFYNRFSVFAQMLTSQCKLLLYVSLKYELKKVQKF